MSKKVNEAIATIKKLAEETIPAYVEKDDANEAGYYALRAELNAQIIQTLVGGTIVAKKKGGNTMKFNKPLPDKAQVAEIAEILQKFVGTVEIPFLAGEQADDDDLDIQIVMKGSAIAPIEKVTGKKLKKAALEGTEAFYRQQLTVVDVMTIAGMGEKVRRRKNIITFAIIGGCTVAIIAGVAVGVTVYKKKKDDKALAEIDEEIATECETDEFEDEEDDEPEVPEVELDD